MSTDASPTTCRYCERSIIKVEGLWVDPEATGDDEMWRETCDQHDTREADHVPIAVPADVIYVPKIIAAIREMYPTATSFEVSSSDQGHYGYWLYAVKFDDSTVIDGDSGTFADLAERVQDEWLSDLSWGVFGDRAADSGFDVDMSTGKIIRRRSK